jgi:hypothetical protein
MQAAKNADTLTAVLATYNFNKRFLRRSIIAINNN